MCFSLKSRSKISIFSDTFNNRFYILIDINPLIKCHKVSCFDWHTFFYFHCFTDACYFCFMSLSTIGFGDMVPGSYPRYNIGDSRNVTVWFCSCYIMSGMALTAMCFNILHDEIVHRLNHHIDNKQDQSKSNQNNVDELVADPFSLTSWQFPASSTTTLSNRNFTQETLCGDNTPTSIFAHDNEINILKDSSYNQVDVTRDCQTTTAAGGGCATGFKIDEQFIPISAVYTLPKLEEETEENTEM